MNGQEIIAVALQAAGLEECPPDTGVLVDGEKIRRVMFGVDMEAAEIHIAKQLGFDGVITHHPVGGLPKLNLYQVMDNQIGRMVAAGVPINKAQKVLGERKDQVERASHVTNYDRAVAAARVLGMPLLAIHSPADLVGEGVIQAHLDKSLAGNPKATLKEVIDSLMELPEYVRALTKPKIRVGREDSFAGKVWVTMAGGTSGGSKVAQAYFEAGVGTLVVMHMPEDTLKAVREQGIGNVVVAGHMASDSVGINRIIAALEAKGLEVTRMAGVIDPN